MGFAAGEIPKVPFNQFLLKGTSAVGVSWGNAVKRDPASHRANMIEVLDWVAAGKLKPVIHGIYPLADIRPPSPSSTAAKPKAKSCCRLRTCCTCRAG